MSGCGALLHPRDRPPGNLRTDVLLHEVAALEARMRLVARAGNVLLQWLVGPAEDRVVPAEEREERLLPVAESLPRGPVRRHGRVVGGGRHEAGEDPRTRLVA